MRCRTRSWERTTVPSRSPVILKNIWGADMSRLSFTLSCQPHHHVNHTFWSRWEACELTGVNTLGREALGFRHSKPDKTCTGLWRERGLHFLLLHKLRRCEHFWKMRSAKYVPDCGESSVCTSKQQKAEGIGALLKDEVGKMCATAFQSLDNLAFGALLEDLVGKMCTRLDCSKSSVCIWNYSKTEACGALFEEELAQNSLIHWLFGSLIQWFIVSIIYSFIDSLIHWFNDSLINCDSLVR